MNEIMNKVKEAFGGKKPEKRTPSRIERVIEQKKIKNPQFEYLWFVELPSLPDSEDQYGKIKTFANQMSELNHRVSSIETPYRQYETKKNTLGSSFYYTASNDEIGSITMKVDEYEDGLTLDYFEHWRKMINGNDYGLQYPPAYYKRNIKVIRVNTVDKETHKFTYLGYFPTGISATSYSYDANGVLSYNISFTGDNVKTELMPYAEIKNYIESQQGKFTADYKKGFGKFLDLAGYL